MSLRTSSLAIVLVASGLASPAHADALNDNFNNYTNDTDFTAASNWVKTGNYNANIVLSASADESPFSAITDGLAARFQDNSTGAGSSSGFGIDLADLNQTQPLFIEFDFKIDVFANNNIIPTFNVIKNDGGAGNFLQLFAKDGEGNAFLGNRTNAGVTLLTNAPVVQGVWNHVRLVIDPTDTAQDTYSVTFTPFGGSPVTVSDLPFRANTGQIIGIQFVNNGANNANGAYVVDNVRVYVPEPASIILAMPAALALLARGRGR